jgi:hypothetical protein
VINLGALRVVHWISILYAAIALIMLYALSTDGRGVFTLSPEHGYYPVPGFGENPVLGGALIALIILFQGYAIGIIKKDRSG